MAEATQNLGLRSLITYKNLVHAIAGATGSTVAITAFYPLDTARTRLQVDDKREAKYSPEVIADILEEEGLIALYRGWLPVVTSVCCSNFVYFYVFNGLKAVSYRHGAKPYPIKDLTLAFLAGVVNVLTTTPLWVANTRLKLQGIKWQSKEAIKENWQVPQYTGLFDCLSKLLRHEGVLSLWSGTVPSIFLATNPAVQFMVYEALKRYLKKGSSHQELSGFTYFLIGALAKMVATFATYPLQVVQSKLRAGREKHKQGLKGLLSTLHEIARSKGVAGLYKGLEAKLTQTMLMAALMFLTYEKIAALVFRLLRFGIICALWPRLVPGFLHQQTHLAINIGAFERYSTSPKLLINPR